MNNLKSVSVVLLILLSGVIFVTAQRTKVSTTPDYKITNLKIVPFDSFTGEFQDAIKTGDTERTFFNDYSISLLVTVEVSAEKGGYESARAVQISAVEGRKIKKTKTEPMVPMEDNGKYYVPLWLDAGMCNTVKITAKITGQKTVATMSRSVMFNCGE
ncbi:hypothetical protein BH10ACI1_BH10ACI1_20280 [soil metagenome]